MKKHGLTSYAKPNHRFKGDTCQKGLADARSLHLHIVANLGRGSHLYTIFENFEVTGLITYAP